MTLYVQINLQVANQNDENGGVGVDEGDDIIQMELVVAVVDHACVCVDVVVDVVQLWDVDHDNSKRWECPSKDNDGGYISGGEQSAIEFPWSCNNDDAFQSDNCQSKNTTRDTDNIKSRKDKFESCRGHFGVMFNHVHHHDDLPRESQRG